MDMKTGTLLDDKYSVFIPIEDHDLLKSVSVDENGDYIVQGVLSSDDVDEEDDSITPEGMDCSYFLEKGWVKYEHGKNPNQFIGEPMEVRVGRFEHPTLMKSVNGIFVKARLFANRELTKQAIEAMTDLQKSHTKRRMGWSIEGNVQERNKKGKIVKSILRNVVLTMNPVNTSTWAELAKSFAKDHEVTIDTDEPLSGNVEKSMDIANTVAIVPQSLEGAGSSKKKKDPQQEWIDLFRDTVKKALLEKSFRSKFIRGSDDASLLAFGEALEKGLDYDEAEDFAEYIAGKHELLKALVTNFGGENMSADTENMLSTLLDSDLEELRKSIEMDSDEGDTDNDDEDEKVEKAIGEDEEGSSEEGDEEEGEDDEDSEGGDGIEKSHRTDLTKSLSEEHGQAFEVSDFLTSLTDEIGFSLEGIEKSMMGVTKQNLTIVKSLATFGSVMQQALAKIDSLEQDNAELQKSLGSILDRPVGRKGVVNQREVQTLSKSLDGQAPSKRLSRLQVIDELVKSFDAGEITGSVVSRYEAGVPLQSLNLPDHLQKAIGLA